MIRTTQHYITFFYLPLLCQLASIYNRVLMYFGIRYLYIFFYILALFALMHKKGEKGYNTSFIDTTWIYVVYLSLIGIVFIVLSHNLLQSVMGLASYVLPLIYWCVYFKRGGEYFVSIVDALKVHIGIVAVFAFVQFFISPTLWGILVSEVDSSLNWAANSSYDDYSVFFRASSFFSSTQSLALFLALYIITVWELVQKTGLHYMILALCFAAGVLTGCKSFYLIIAIYILYKTIKSHKLKYWFYIVPAVVLLFFFLNQFSDELQVIQRVLDSDSIVHGGNEERLANYSYYFKKTTLFGSGPGSIMDIFVTDPTHYIAPESYLVQLLYELGVISFLLFGIMMFCGYVSNKHRILIIAMVIGMAVVHCFSSFEYFIMWALLFQTRQKKLPIEASPNKQINICE